MINYKTILKVLGTLSFIEALMMLLCFGICLLYREDDFMPFLISVMICLLFGFLLKYFGRESDNTLMRKDAYLVVTLAWLFFSSLGTLPFLFSGYITNFTDAFFENMSGFTSTGATILDNVQALPHGLLFWRSLTQWVGGLGIVFFTVALLPSLTGGSVKIFAAESTGPIKTKLHPRLSSNVKLILSVYLVLTIACIISFMFFGMDWFSAVNYAMTSTATGGFSIHNNSLEFFNSPAIDYTCALFCFLSGTNFTLLYLFASKHDLKTLYKNSEFKFYFSIVFIFTVFVMIQLIIKLQYPVEEAFRSSLFQVVSIITTTGLFNDDAGKWPHVTWAILGFCMFLGASSGSTSGGLKCIRGVMLLKCIRNEFMQILHPNAVVPLKIDGISITNQTRNTLLSFFATYLLLVGLSTFVLMLAKVDSTNAITIVLSSIGNVGPSFGLEIGPTMSWNILPNFIKWLCSFLMLVGRLEIFSVLVILTPSFWNKS